ncbi:hypothetical protein FisN_22Hh118 [Fistulifera solaris]|jgi:hypothetical protein|uniref:Uncharacterized protein n=1 Tax=Fistulifera solaris TaxID=1519565 RepID=A0A1Z5JPT8_FISSO|nr:hypothetical protein FisN_22Hh118 [Fistulifera solaris]|eukprot:GAX16024.1 hypothetical protein FisN_22Hh118 [Fistulifera solaris]
MHSSDQVTATKAERIAKKQDELLLELSATVNALSNIHQVLGDIVRLTSVGTPGGVAEKQQNLLAELGKWKDL